MLKAQYVPQAFNQFKNTQFDTFRNINKTSLPDITMKQM